MDPTANVVIWWRQVGDRAIGAAFDEHVAPAFLRTPLEPVDVVAVTRDEPQAESLFGNRRGGNARRPGAVRSDQRHDRGLTYRFFDDLRPPLRDPIRFGTFAPASRASERPMAMACLRLVTRLPERPLFSVPRLRSRIARSTFSPAFFPYLAMTPSIRGR